MDAVTYPNLKVADFLNEKVVALQLSSFAEPYARDYLVKWTPCLLMLDAEGKEHHRTVGFLPPLEFLPSLKLGIGKAYFDKNRYNEAIAVFDSILSDYVSSASAPEAAFFRGVARYKSTHEAIHLKKMFQFLQERYRNSEWAARAYPYWLLPI
ncbi:MAG: hypothetical protein LLG06_00115 [Desulfobacteraceae bacterium]|nr:hypothetical protein [Desulfobacteraceae bacterium]